MLRFAIFFLLLFWSGSNAIAQSSNTLAAPQAAKDAFRDLGFGLFVHWGPYSQVAHGEWLMHTEKIATKPYEAMAAAFNPSEYNPTEWVQLAKKAGMQYITVTTRHHDGFAMFDTKQNNYSLVKHTPYGRDAMKMLAEACQKEGMKLCFYYSLLDWHHTDFYPRGKTGWASARPDSGNFARYVAFMEAQLTELLTGYGPITAIWFDGEWDAPKNDWQFQRIYNTIHKLQPNCLVGNNHHHAPRPGEDFQMFEKDLPGANTAGFIKEAVVVDKLLPLETCETMAVTWGYDINDRKFKSAAQLWAMQVRAAGHNANFLLNVGPMANGKIQQEFADTLAKVGIMNSRYGQTVKGSRGLGTYSWGAITQVGSAIYIHILSPETDQILLPAKLKVGKGQAMVLGNTSKIATLTTKAGIILSGVQPGQIIKLVAEAEANKASNRGK